LQGEGLMKSSERALATQLRQIGRKRLRTEVERPLQTPNLMTSDRILLFIGHASSFAL
jgi:hypothetical protein